MKNYEKESYKEALNYKEYEEKLSKAKIDSTNYTSEANIENIYDVDEGDFVWIFIWSQWLKKPRTCFTWQFDNNANVWEKNTETKSFYELNLNPYRNANGHGISRCIPVVDVSDFITIFNGGTSNTDFNKLFSIPYDKYLKEIKTFDFYIDARYDKLKDSANGTFFEIINTIGYSPDLFYAKNSFATGSSIIDVTYKSIHEEKLNLIEKLYEKIKLEIKSDWTEEQLKERKLEISDLAGKISKIVSSYVSMYADVYNIYQQTVTKEPLTPPQLDISGLKINREDVGSLPIEETLRLSRPPVQPAFKKSYIVRENNLKAFVTIKMEYQVGAAATDFITLNYFDIPYNSILSIEHSVKDFNMTINLIDTQGNLSELFIQKMYAVSQKKSNALVQKNLVDALGEYRFLIEYGWAGPDSDNDDELLEEQVYVKTIHRGYIKSISSQYTFKGTEYTLSIIPNDLSQFNSGFNDTNSLYYSPPAKAPTGKTTPLSIPIGLLILSLVLDDPIVGLYQKVKTRFPAPTDKRNFLFKLFDLIEGTLVSRFDSGNRDSNGNIIYFTNFEVKISGVDHQICGRKKKATKDLADLFYKLTGNVNGGSIGGINFNTAQFERLSSISDTETIGLNAWVAGMYVIWKTLSNLKTDNKEHFMVADLTGLFSPFIGDFGEMTNESLCAKIEYFNPYCLRKEKIPTSANDDKIYGYIITDSDFNKYYTSSILNLRPDGAISINDEETKKSDLTFVIKQLGLIFSSIKNIGMNVENNISEYNVYEGSDGINLIYDIFKKADLEDKDTLNKIFENYKRKIYSEKDSIFTLKDDTKSIEKRETIEYEGFEKALNSIANKNPNSVEFFYLSYITNPNKVAFLNCSLSKKISLLSRQIVQSYSFSPRMSPTRNANKQFFGQGNSQLLKEGSGDIIEFSIDPIDIGNFNSIMLANKNKNNVAFNNVSSHTFVGGLHQNAAQYYRTYRNIDGTENITKLTQDMARLDLNYQSQTAIKGSITIPGEPYWSNVNLLMAKCIYINVYYSSGMRSSHSGLYYVSNVVQNISEGKFTTKLEIIRAPTFLSPLEKIVNKNKFVS